MRPEERLGAAVEALHQELLRAGEDVAQIRCVLESRDPEDAQLVSLLRCAVPVRLLEFLGTTPPWALRPSVAAQIVLHPRSPRALSLRLVSSLYWRQLAEVAGTPHVPGAVRVRAEASLKDMLQDLRLGERITLARLATPLIIRELLGEREPRILESLLENPRLRVEELCAALRSAGVTPTLIDAAARSQKWSERYEVKLELARQPKTPLSVALLQVSSLVKRDLLRLAEARELRPLLRMAAQRVAEGEGTSEDSDT